VTKSENSFDLIVFCGGTVSTQGVFLCECELWAGKLLSNFGTVKRRVLRFWGHFYLSVWLFLAILLAVFAESVAFLKE